VVFITFLKIGRDFCSQILIILLCLTRDASPSPFDTQERFMATKTNCPISRQDFKTKARPVSITINGVPLQAEAREFSTGSLGWYLNGKTMIDVGGTPVSVQIGMNLTVVGSKDLPKESGTSGNDATT
jgi:hypothetical protein